MNEQRNGNGNEENNQSGNLFGLSRNRVIIIAVAVLAIAGYIGMRFNREGISNRIEKRKPPYLTIEFAESQRAQAAPGDEETAAAVLEDADEYFDSRNFREAGSAYHRAIALYPTAEAYFHYARYMTAMNQLAWVEDTLDLAGEMGYPSENVLYEKARLYAIYKKPTQSLQFLQQAIEGGFDDFDMIRQEKDFDPVRYSIETRNSWEGIVSPENVKK